MFMEGGGNTDSAVVTTLGDSSLPSDRAEIPLRTGSSTEERRPTSTVEPAYSSYRARSLPNPNDVYADALRDARRQARPENEQLENERRQELMNVTNEYQEELKRKAAEYAAYSVATEQNLSKNKHQSQLKHLTDKLTMLRNTDVRTLAPPDVLLSAVEAQHTANTTRGRGVQESQRVVPPTAMHAATVSQRPSGQLALPRFPAPAMRPSLPVHQGPILGVSTASTSTATAHMSQGVIPPSVSQDGSDVRRSPRAHPSSRSFDAQSRSNTDPAQGFDANLLATVLSDLQGACANVSNVTKFQESGPRMQPVKKPIMMKRKSDEGSSQSADVLDDIFGPKRNRSGQEGVPLNSRQPSELNRVAAQKIEKARDLDKILSEDLKLENKAKIKQFLDMHSVDVKANPSPKPEDTFCYNCSLLTDPTSQIAPEVRAANLRKMVINYVATHLSQFSEVSRLMRLIFVFNC